MHVEINDDVLTLSGERKQESKEEREGYFRSERSYGKFTRTIPLPEGISADTAKASFNNGVLEIEMNAPKQKTTTGRRIEIQDTPSKAQQKRPE